MLIVNFLFVTKLFSLGVTAETLQANINWKSVFLKGVGQFQPNFYVEGDVVHEHFLHGWIGQ